MSRAPVTPFAIISGPAKSENGCTNACTCMSHRPGTRNFPRPSITVAPSGIEVDAAGPEQVILLPATNTVLSGWIAPVATSITETLVIAIAFRVAGPAQAVPANNATATA